MANGITTSPQSGGIMDAIGSGVEGLAGIAGKILPYALPIGLGAVMGHGLPGGALGGGAMGLAMAEGASGERQAQEKEFALKQQQMALEAQKWDLDKKKLQLDIDSGQDLETTAKGIKDPLQRAAFRADPKAWVEQQDFKHWFEHVSNDPGYAGHQGMDPQLVEAMKGLPVKQQQELLMKYEEARATGKVVNGFHQVTNKDGSTTLYMAGPLDPATGMPKLTPLVGGVSPKVIPGAPTAPKPIDVKTAGAAYMKDNKPPTAISSGAAGLTGGSVGESLEDWRARGVASMVALGIDEDKAKKYMAEQGGKKTDAAAPKTIDSLPLDARPDPAHPGFYYSKSKNKYYKKT